MSGIAPPLAVAPETSMPIFGIMTGGPPIGFICGFSGIFPMAMGIMFANWGGMPPAFCMLAMNAICIFAGIFAGSIAGFCGIPGAFDEPEAG